MTPMRSRQGRLGLACAAAERRYWWMPNGVKLAISGGNGSAPCGRRIVMRARSRGMLLVAWEKR
jgi:hypothetical protein